MTVTRFTPEHASDDARLVRHAQAGDEDAFATLYRRYARVVHGLLLARVPRDEVDDLVQDVFLIVWRRLDSLRDAAALVAGSAGSRGTGQPTINGMCRTVES